MGNSEFCMLACNINYAMATGKKKGKKKGKEAFFFVRSVFAENYSEQLL